MCIKFHGRSSIRYLVWSETVAQSKRLELRCIVGFSCASSRTLALLILYLEEDGHGSNDASFLNGSTEAVKVIRIVKVDLHLGWETEHKQLKEWTRRANSPVINHLDTLLRS